MKRKGYVGTYTKRESRGIYSFDYENGEIGNLELWAQVKNPKYLCFAGKYLASICEFEDGAGVALFDLNANKLDEIKFEEVSSCYLTYHEGKLYTANYHEGCVHVIAVKDGKLTLIQRVDIKPNAGTHQIIFWEDKFIVPCLLLDKVFVFNKNFKELGQISFESGAGPRHGLFIPNSSYLYVVGETSNYLYAVDLKQMKVVGEENLIAEHSMSNTKQKGADEHSASSLKQKGADENSVSNSKQKGADENLESGSKFEHAANEDELKNLEPTAASAIRYYEGKVYVSIRGADVISVLEIDEEKMPKLVKNISSFGKHPRDFLIVDHYLLIANRESDNLVLFDLESRCEELSKESKEAFLTQQRNSGKYKAKTVLEGAFEGISVLLAE